ncbi:hypothetical protein D3C86_936050 [compost metagenome]
MVKRKATTFRTCVREVGTKLFDNVGNNRGYHSVSASQLLGSTDTLVTQGLTIHIVP